jgi:branched-chain amino acid transport system permease protein
MHFAFDRWAGLALLAFLAIVPQLPIQQYNIADNRLMNLLIMMILALGLNVVIGYAGLLHLGIAAFFGIGAVITGILTVPIFPFQQSFIVAMACSILGTAIIGFALAAPILRLRGDYFALVTLGFGQIVVTALNEFSFLTGGKKTLDNLHPTLLPEWIDGITQKLGFDLTWQDFPNLYYVIWFFLALVYFLLWNLERSRLGRALIALREDELAASCMGLNPARLKLIAMAIGAGLAGMAGCLYAIQNTNTTEPQTSFIFPVSTIILASIILGGIGSRPGVLFGVFILIGFDYIVTPLLDEYLQRAKINPENKQYLKLSSWRLLIFGMTLILMMRFRPEGVIPARRGKH